MQYQEIRHRNGATDKLIDECVDIDQLIAWRDDFEKSSVDMSSSILESDRKKEVEGIPYEDSYFKTKTARMFNNLLLEKVKRRIYQVKSMKFQVNDDQMNNLSYAFMYVAKGMVEEALFEEIRANAVIMLLNKK